MLGLSLDIYREFAFYGAYHSNAMNQLVHIIFVPLIWGSMACWLAYLPLYPNAPKALNWSIVFYLVYAVYYFLLDFQTALFVNLLYAIMLYYINEAVRKEQNTPKSKRASSKSFSAAKWALIVHVSSWIAQIAAHQIFEGRAPALLDSFAQSVITNF